MDHERATNLAEFLRTRGQQPLAPGEALIYLRTLAASLQHVHERGLVHGDIRPSNVLFDAQGRVYLEGVGFAQRIGSRSVVHPPLQPTPYQAPELVSYQVVNEATDVYGLGVLAYELLTAEAPAEIVGKFRSPQQLNPSIPPALSQAVMRALARDPAERFSTPQEFFTAACSALGVSPERVPDHPAPATLILTAAPNIQPPATQVIQSDERAQDTLVAAPPPQAFPVEPAYPQQPGSAGQPRPAWLWIGIGLLGLALLLCAGLLVALLLPDWIGGREASNTPTWTSTTRPSDTPFSSPPPLFTATLPLVIPSETLPPPPPTLEPTLVFASPLPPTEPPAVSGGALKVRNRFPYGIYVFRGRSILNTTAIPSGMYLIFYNQPAGMHLYLFCKDPNMRDCLEKQIEINGDLEIGVP